MRGVLEAAFSHAPIGMALVDMSGRMLHVNEALCRITGYTTAQIRGRAFRDLSDPQDADLETPRNQDLLQGRVPAYHVEKRYQHALGHSVWVLLSVSLVRDDAGSPLYLIAQVQDISAQKKRETRLEHLVDHDFLTMLYNGRRFEQALVQEIKCSARYGDGGGAVLLLDVDHFKAVNDRFGHKTGDDLLKTVAGTLRGRMRETDVLARLGGDEFGIILPRVDGAKAEKVADGIVKALRRQTAMPAEAHVPVTASVGVALFDGLTSLEIMAAADLAMYEAKALGRNRFSVYQPSCVSSQRVQSRLRGADISRTINADAVCETGRLGPQTMPGHREPARHARRAVGAARPQGGRVGSPGGAAAGAGYSSRGGGG
jgi:diguanylate cyclase (GGDEF)-like protein/PAS domain S-box-containing protein